MISVMIVDDHKLVREGIKLLIAGCEDLSVVDEAENGEEAMEKLRTNNYDVVLLDISLPGFDGLELLKRTKREGLKLSVLVLSMLPEEQYAIRAFRAGALGYLSKESASTELIQAIYKVAKGIKYISLSHAENMATQMNQQRATQIHEELSDREYQVLFMIAQGKRVGEIAENLSLSPKTVSTYRTKILKKMNLANNADIMRYAMRKKLVS